METKSPKAATESLVLTNDIEISNLPSRNCSFDKLNEYFHNKKKSGINSFKDIKIVDQNTAILCLEDEEGTHLCKLCL